MNFALRKKLNRYCLVLAALLFSCCLLLPAIGSSLGIEFGHQQEAALFKRGQGLGLLAALGLLFIGLLLTITHWLDVLIRLIVFGLVAFVLYGIVLFTVFSGMCTWTTSAILFEQRADPATVIAVRGMGCGATDSSPPVYQTFAMIPLTSHFVRVVKTDTARLDRKQWRRVRRRPARRL